MEAKNKLFDVPITVSNPILSFKNQKPKIIKQYVYIKCDCKRRRAYEVTVMDLPRVIMVEILSRLPIKPIFRAKTVCKRWYNLFSDPLFLKMYYTRSSNIPCLLFSSDGSVSSILELNARYDYHSRPQNRPIMLRPRFHLPRLKSKSYCHDYGVSYVKPELELIGSCNGFVCLLNGDTFHEYHSVYISNPLLGEYFEVKLPEWEKRIRRVSYAFCFSEGSGQYKVLRSVVRKFRGRPEVSELDVYILGADESWRNVGEAPFPKYGSFRNVIVNGGLHWLDNENGEKSAKICSFDIWTEKVKSVPPPPGLETPSFCLMLAELGNCLCLSDNSYMTHVDIWWMKEYGIAESWIRDRISMDSIPCIMRDDRYIPIVIWKDGEILMQSDHGTRLISYNTKEKKFKKKVNVYGNGTAATRYTPSFYSLKTVVGDYFQVSNVYPKTEII